jgi:hypothetical protein
MSLFAFSDKMDLTGAHEEDEEERSRGAESLDPDLWEEDWVLNPHWGVLV